MFGPGPPHPHTGPMAGVDCRYGGCATVLVSIRGAMIVGRVDWHGICFKNWLDQGN